MRNFITELFCHAGLARPRWPQRALALTGLAAVTASLALVPVTATSAAAGRPAAAVADRPTAAASRPAAPQSIKVKGPHMYDPATGKPFPQASTVTVSQNTGLTNQLIHVSWTNFTPSVNNAPGPFYEYNFSYYAVMVVECRGVNPASYTDCYEADDFGVPMTFGTAGPPNAAYAITAPNGTSQTGFYVETGELNKFLRCGQEHPCSLAIVPDQGGTPGTPLKCNDHSQDVLPSNEGNALATNGFNFTPVGTGTCSWQKRIIIPLRFAPAPSGCPHHKPAFTAEGSPMLFDAMQQWQTGMCPGRHGLVFDYNADVGEPLAVQDVVNGPTDMALTTRPASADGIPTGHRHFVYAPVAVSATSVAYWIDNNTTGQQLSGLKVNQRLLAKLLTTSYNPGVACHPHPPPPPAPCDKGVNYNPFDMFRDHEFRQLDPAIASAVSFFGIGNAYVVPTVLYGDSDMTWTVTRWIGANPDASAFLAGQPDPFGMHVNTYYLGLKYPTDQFSAQDPIGTWSRLYNPQLPLSRVVDLQVLNMDAGQNTPSCTGNHCYYTQDPPEPAGVRRLVAVIDQGDAALNGFPTAAIPNAAGAYVQPTNATMAAALSHMVSDGSGTLQVNLKNKDPHAYPLTMVIYAMAPTSGLSHAKARAIARFIDYAVGPGQTPGLGPGHLPAGYLPLTAKLRAQARKAAAQIAAQG
jgi:ABC-type phosphate transport system substrate-binding protein